MFNISGSYTNDRDIHMECIVPPNQLLAQNILDNPKGWTASEEPVAIMDRKMFKVKCRQRKALECPGEYF